MIIIAVIAFVVIAGGAGAFFYFSSNSAEIDSNAPLNDKVNTEKGESYYVELEPPFIINFIYKDTLRYLQLTLSVMTHEEEIINIVTHHMPAIRHQLIMLLSDKTFNDLHGEEKKEGLRKDMLKAIRNIVQSENTSPFSGSRVEAVYFTGYVMQ